MAIENCAGQTTPPEFGPQKGLNPPRSISLEVAGQRTKGLVCCGRVATQEEVLHGLWAGRAGPSDRGASLVGKG